MNTVMLYLRFALIFVFVWCFSAACSADSVLQDITVEVSASSNVSGLTVGIQADGVGENIPVVGSNTWTRQFDQVQILTISATGYTMDDQDGFVVIKLREKDNPERVVRASGKDIRCMIAYP